MAVTSSFFSRLEDRIEKINSLLCIGLDPHPIDLPEYTPLAAKEFCLNIIDATADVAAVFKPNIAFFEALGPKGLEALQEIIAAVPDEIPVVLDAKRGDISSTAQAYADAVFQTYNADAVTINAYLGYDSLAPFLEFHERGVFILCRTTNPGAEEIQDVILQSGDFLHEHLAKLAQVWNKHNNLGLVVGATHPEALSRIRQAAPDLWILAPGIGAQGGDLASALLAGLRADGLGFLAAVSRGISRAKNPRQTAISLRDTINTERKKLKSQASFPEIPYNLTELAQGLFESGCLKFGDFTLKSGLQSPIYIDLRLLISSPTLLNRIAKAYQPILNELTFDRIAAIPYAALPIGTAVSLQGNWPMIYPRKEEKEYGTKAAVEGEYKQGESVVVIDDLVTTGESKFEVIEKLTRAGLVVNDIVVLIDRESGAKQALAESGLKLHAIFTLTELITHLKNNNLINNNQFNAVKTFIKYASTS